MGLEKSIKSGKEKRKSYRRSKSVDGSCRNHGGCDWCLGNRLHKYKKKELKIKDFADMV